MRLDNRVRCFHLLKSAHLDVSNLTESGGEGRAGEDLLKI